MRKIINSIPRREIIIFAAIVSVLAFFIAVVLLDNPNKGLVATANAEMNVLVSALKLYKLDNGIYPSTEQGLSALIRAPETEPLPESYKAGGYIVGKLPKDPTIDVWGNKYIYVAIDNGTVFELTSLGSDGRREGKRHKTDITIRSQK
ncbi:type II secretion system major pseudopilin GspG [Deferribacterales bacterium RsTz2092]|nr:type II secretion system protein GspG [Deferribacterales bacterium]